MAEGYAKPDFNVVDYELFVLDSELSDPATNDTLLLRGPRPANLEKGHYFVCIGAAQTFGRFCEKPYPILLQDRLGIQSINLGRGGAGPSFFSKNSDKLINFINNAKFAIIQVMSSRSESNSLFESKGIGFYTKTSDGSPIDCDNAYKELLMNNDKKYIKNIVNETRENWLHNYIELLDKIEIPKILFWFSTRHPAYEEGDGNIYELFGEFPQLVNSSMIKKIKKSCDDYVECISNVGMPQQLIDRFTGKPTIVQDEWNGIMIKNWYYPSPEMHIAAANILTKVCQKFLMNRIFRSLFNLIPLSMRP